MSDTYIKLEDVLALIPYGDICEPKLSYLRKQILDLPTIIIHEMEDDSK